MEAESCPLYKCSIFFDNPLISEEALEFYRRLYCLAGKEKYALCKRFQIFEEIGKVLPASVLPNSMLPVEQIRKMLEG
jgi:hypothetical protein